MSEESTAVKEMKHKQIIEEAEGLTSLLNIISQEDINNLHWTVHRKKVGGKPKYVDNLQFAPGLNIEEALKERFGGGDFELRLRNNAGYVTKVAIRDMIVNDENKHLAEKFPLRIEISVEGKPRTENDVDSDDETDENGMSVPFKGKRFIPTFPGPIGSGGRFIDRMMPGAENKEPGMSEKIIDKTLQVLTDDKNKNIETERERTRAAEDKSNTLLTQLLSSKSDDNKNQMQLMLETLKSNKNPDSTMELLKTLLPVMIGKSDDKKEFVELLKVVGSKDNDANKVLVELLKNNATKPSDDKSFEFTKLIMTMQAENAKQMAMIQQESTKQAAVMQTQMLSLQQQSMQMMMTILSAGSTKSEELYKQMVEMMKSSAQQKTDSPLDKLDMVGNVMSTMTNMMTTQAVMMNKSVEIAAKNMERMSGIDEDKEKSFASKILDVAKPVVEKFAEMAAKSQGVHMDKEAVWNETSQELVKQAPNLLPNGPAKEIATGIGDIVEEKNDMIESYLKQYKDIIVTPLVGAISGDEDVDLVAAMILGEEIPNTIRSIIMLTPWSKICIKLCAVADEDEKKVLMSENAAVYFNKVRARVKEIVKASRDTVQSTETEAETD